MIDEIKFDARKCKNAKGEIDTSCLMTEVGNAIQSVASNIAALNDSHKVMKRQLDGVKNKVEKVELQNNQLAEKLGEFIQLTETRFDGMHRELETMKNELRQDMETTKNEINQEVTQAKNEIIAAVRDAVNDVARRNTGS